MELKYIVRENVPYSFGKLLGIQGIMHVIHDGAHSNDAHFTMVIDEGCGPDKLWGVIGLFRPVSLAGKPTGGDTFILFGDAGKQPFKRFEDAMAFCRAVCGEMYDKPVKSEFVDNLCANRGMSATQWLDKEVQAAPEGGDEGDDSEGGTCDIDVEVSIPTNRVLH